VEDAVKKAKDYRVKVKIGDATLDIQGAETGVVRIVEALSDVLRGAKKSTPVATASVPSPISPAVTRSAPIDIRNFFEEKKPSSDVEAAAATAYYYAYLLPERDRKETIDAATLQDAFRLARRPLPARTIFTLNNARNAGYLDSVGEGQFRLNPVGYNLVEHALGRESTTEKGRRKPKPKPKKTRRK
jgi:hypothetical protein